MLIKIPRYTVSQFAGRIRSLSTCPAGTMTNESDTASGKEKDVKDFDSMPSIKGIPLLGNALAYTKLGPYKFEKIEESKLAYMKKYGKIYREKLGPTWTVNIFDPVDGQTVLKSEIQGKYPYRGPALGALVKYCKEHNRHEGFALKEGEDWYRERMKFQKHMMHPNAPAQYLHLQEPVAADFVEYIEKCIGPDRVVPDLIHELYKYTMESIGTVVFGNRMNVMKPDEEIDKNALQLLTSILSIFGTIHKLVFDFPWYKIYNTSTYKQYEAAVTKMDEVVAVYVQEVLNAIDSKKRREGILETLATQEGIDYESAVDTAVALFSAGVDSTAKSLGFLLYNISRHPQVQEKLYEEICNILPDNKPLTQEDLKKMVYLKVTLKESFRVHFPVFGMMRIIQKDAVLSGYRVPKGTPVFFNCVTMGMMEEYFPNPQQFQPERWLRKADEGGKRDLAHTFAVLPFGQGVRNCVGKRFAEQEVYLAVVKILQHFRLEYNDPEEVGTYRTLFTEPDRPLKIAFIPRTKGI